MVTYQNQGFKFAGSVGFRYYSSVPYFCPLEITWDNFLGVWVRQSERRVLLLRTFIEVTCLRAEFMVEGWVNSIESARIVTELSCTEVLQFKGRSEQVYNFMVTFLIPAICCQLILPSRSQWPRGLRRRVCGRLLAGIAGSNPAGGMDVCHLWVLCVVR